MGAAVPPVTASIGASWTPWSRARPALRSKPVECKGSHVVAARDVIDQELGAGSFAARWHEAGGAWSPLVLPGAWYDANVLAKVIRGAAMQAGERPVALTARIARRNAEHDLTSIYRVFLRDASPQRLLALIPDLWRNYVAFADSRVIRNDPGYCVGHCIGVPSRLREWAEGIWLGFLPTAIQLAGGKNARGRTLGASAMDPSGRLYRMEFEYTYSVA